MRLVLPPNSFGICGAILQALIGALAEGASCGGVSPPNVYAVEWTPKELRFFVDELSYFTYANEGLGSGSWPFDRDQYLILNLAIGGTWGARKGVDAGAFPQRFEIDYVRVYQKEDRRGADR